MCYPPGIPILAPGELITKEIAQYIVYAKEKGCSMPVSYTHLDVYKRQVAGLDLGVFGAALATLIAQGISAVFSLLIFFSLSLIHIY